MVHSIMKTRQEIKAQAKSIIGGNYSGALLPGLLYLLIAAVASGVTFGLGGYVQNFL